MLLRETACQESFEFDAATQGYKTRRVRGQIKLRKPQNRGVAPAASGGCLYGFNFVPLNASRNSVDILPTAGVNVLRNSSEDHIMSTPEGSSWRCKVCGYVHRGPEPPDWCPVCGAEKSDFEQFEEKAPAPAKSKVKRWHCTVCGYEHEGDEPPDECPLCGALKDCFEPLAEKEAAHAPADRPDTVVVLGGGIAGVSAVEALKEASPESKVILISREPHLPYYRLNLTRYLAGEVDDDSLPIHPQEWYDENNVELRLHEDATALPLDEHKIQLRGGDSIPFDKLILTVGAHPFIPPFPGAQREGVTSLRTVDDARRILELSHSGMRCVCIGGGILGLETAGALAQRGLDVTLLEGHGWLMPRQLNQRAGELLTEHARNRGIRLLTEARTDEIVGDERVRAVALESGDTIDADLVVIATGVRPNSFLARRAGLDVNQGVVVNNRLITSHADVLAAGDVAEHRGTVYGIWPASQYQGNIAGMSAAGLDAEFGGIPRSNTLKVLGFDMFSIGRVEPEDGSYRIIEEESDGRYCRFVFRDSHLLGAVLLGDTKAATAAKKAIEDKTDFSALFTKCLKATPVIDHLVQQLG